MAATGPCGAHDPGTIILTKGGNYTITVSAPIGAVESYKFQIFNVVPQSFNIGLGQVVTNGVPAVGAGNVETPGALDVYTFNATAGQVVYFDAQSRDNCSFPLLLWRCVDAKGAVVFDQRFAASGPCGPRDPGSLVLTNGGVYTITVYGSEDSTGTYQFELFDVVPQSFNIGIGQVVTNGVPAVGAGNLETPGALDIYTFNATAGQVVYFDAQSRDNCSFPSLSWRCVDARGAVVFDQRFAASGPCGPHDPGSLVLTNGGVYTITVYGLEDSTGTYQFELFDVVPQSFNIGIGQVVTNGVPAAGAGNLETPGAQDVYTFNATAGQVVYFDAQSRDNCSFPSLLWRCVDAKGAVVFDQRFAASGPCGRHDPRRWCADQRRGLHDYGLRFGRQHWDVSVRAVRCRAAVI